MKDKFCNDCSNPKDKSNCAFWGSGDDCSTKPAPSKHQADNKSCSEVGLNCTDKCKENCPEVKQDMLDIRAEAVKIFNSYGVKIIYNLRSYYVSTGDNCSSNFTEQEAKEIARRINRRY